MDFSREETWQLKVGTTSCHRCWLRLATSNGDVHASIASGASGSCIKEEVARGLMETLLTGNSTSKTPSLQNASLKLAEILQAYSIL